MLPVGVAQSTYVVGGCECSVSVCVRSVCGVCTLRYFLAIFFCSCTGACLTAHTHTEHTHGTHIQQHRGAVYMYVWLLKDLPERRPRRADRQQDRAKLAWTLHYAASKKETFSISSTAFEGQDGRRGGGQWERGCTSMLSLFACSMQCLCLPLLLQVNLPHGLNLLTVCERERERERDSERKRGRKGARGTGRKERQTDAAFSLRWQFISLQASEIFHKFFRLCKKSSNFVTYSAQITHVMHM